MNAKDYLSIKGKKEIEHITKGFTGEYIITIDELNEFAKIKCREQVILCSVNTIMRTDHPSGEYPVLTKESVFNTPLPKF